MEVAARNKCTLSGGHWIYAPVDVSAAIIRSTPARHVPPLWTRPLVFCPSRPQASKPVIPQSYHTPWARCAVPTTAVVKAPFHLNGVDSQALPHPHPSVSVPRSDSWTCKCASTSVLSLVALMQSPLLVDITLTTVSTPMSLHCHISSSFSVGLVVDSPERRASKTEPSSSFLPAAACFGVTRTWDQVYPGLEIRVYALSGSGGVVEVTSGGGSCSPHNG